MNSLAVSSKPAVGDQAPDIEAPDETGTSIRLSHLWRDRPLVLVFLRHLGCPLCRAHVASVLEGCSRLQEAGADVTLVAMGTPEQAAAFRQRYQLPFRILADADQRVYQAFGVPRGGVAAVMGPSMWRRGWLALFRHGVGKIIGDPYQLPGSFIIDTAGVIRLAHRATSSADWPSNEELLAALKTPAPA